MQWFAHKSKPTLMGMPRYATHTFKYMWKIKGASTPIIKVLVYFQEWHRMTFSSTTHYLERGRGKCLLSCNNGPIFIIESFPD